MKSKINHHGGNPVGTKLHGKNPHGNTEAAGRKVGRLKSHETRPHHRRPPGSKAQIHHLGGKKRVSIKEGNHEVPQQQKLFCKGRPLLKRTELLRGATLRKNIQEVTLDLLARGDPALILQEATPAAVVHTIMLTISLSSFSEAQ